MDIKKITDSVASVIQSSVINRSSGIGTNSDLPKSSLISRSTAVSEREIAALYLSSGLIEKVVDLIPSLAKMVRVRVDSDLENFDTTPILKEFENRKILKMFTEASISARLFRESYLIVDIDDGKDFAEPVEINECNGVKEVFFREYGALKPLYNESRTERIAYEITKSSYNLKSDTNLENNEKQIIHKDRVVLFTGRKLTPKLEQSNNSMHAGIIDRIIEPYTTMAYSYNNVSSILSRVLTFVYKMKGLLSLLDLGQENTILKRLRLAKNNIGGLGGILLDADTEEILPMTVPLSGIPETMKSIKEFFTAQSELTHDQLWNEGSYDTASMLEDKNFQRIIHNFVNNNWIENFQYIGKLIATQYTKSTEEINFFLELPEANRTLKDDLETKYIQAQIDAIYINAGVISREIIQANRFGSNPYDTNLKLSSNVGIEEQPQENSEDEDKPITDTKFTDANYSSDAYNLTSDDVRQILEDVKLKSPTLFDFLNAEQE